MLLFASIGRAAEREPETLIDAPFVQWTRDPFLAGPPESQDLRCVALDERNRVFVGSDQGLFRVDRDHLTRIGEGLLDGPVYCLHGHPVTGIWVGGWNGVYRMKGSELRRLGDLEGPISAIGPGGTGMLVANSAGLHRWNDDLSQWEPLEARVPTSVRRVLPGVRGIYQIIATDVGLYECEGRKVSLRTYDGVPDFSSQIRDVVPLVTRKDSPLVGIWIATSNAIVRDSLVRPTGPDRTIQVWRAEPARSAADNPFCLPTADTRRLLPVLGPTGADDALWAGTARGLVRITSGQPPQLFHSQRWLPSDDVRDLVAGPDRSLWVATAGGLAHLIPQTMTLEDKARFFEEMIRARHVRPPGLIERCQLTRAGDLGSFRPFDTDNDGEYTGTYLAAESFHFATTADPRAKANAQAAFRAMAFLEEVTGGEGFVARTVVPSDWTQMADPNRSHSPIEVAGMKIQNPREKIVERRWRLSKDLAWLWKGDTSSDEITGHLYAYDVFAEFAASPEERKQVSDLVARIVDRLMRDGYVLKDDDGSATLWGVWAPEKLNDDPNWINERGVNSVEILSYLTTAHWLTGNPKYDEAIEHLLRDHHYDQNILRPRPTDPGAYTYIDDELLAMAYWGLIRHETKPGRLALYRQSMDQWFQSVQRDASPLYNFIYAILTKSKPIDYRRNACVTLLREVPLDMIHWSIDNTWRRDVQLVGRPQAESVQTDRLLPPGEIPVLRWDNNPYVAAGGEGGMAEMCPSFWLWPYWMGRWARIIGEVTR
jgi:hypothetical protein